MAPPVILLTGFEPFGGETENPSWEVARRFDRIPVDGAIVRAFELPVALKPAIRSITGLITRLDPAVVLGLGQAGGRPTVSVERVAVNLFSEDEAGSGSIRPVIQDGPDAYLARIPIDAVVRAISRADIPAASSLSAGAFVCNAVMYAALHALRRRRNRPAGFIHLPYSSGQAARHRGVASMSLDAMERAVGAALEVISSRAT